MELFIQWPQLDLTTRRRTTGRQRFWKNRSSRKKKRFPAKIRTSETNLVRKKKVNEERNIGVVIRLE